MAPAPVVMDYLRTLLALGMLGYASYRDLKTREIIDTVWIVPSALALIIDAYEVYAGYLPLTQALVSIGFMAVFSGVLWYLQLFGEADLIAFVALAVIHPRTPAYSFIGYTPLLFSFTMLANSALSGLVTAFYSLYRNLMIGLRGVDLFERHGEASGLIKIGLMFTGYYMETAKVRGPPFEYPLEVKGELLLKPDIWDDDKAWKDFRVLKEKGYGRVWVSATLPYIVNLLIGYLISVVYGDVLFTLMSRITG